MMTCPVCGSVMQSDGKNWRCPFQTLRTQYDPHPGVEKKDRRQSTGILSSFVCGSCGKPGIAEKKVTATREVTYPKIPGAHKFTNRDGIKTVKDDPGGVGIEIVSEVLVCKSCAE